MNINNINAAFGLLAALLWWPGQMPEFDDWLGKDRFPNNIEAAYRAVRG